MIKHSYKKKFNKEQHIKSKENKRKEIKIRSETIEQKNIQTRASMMTKVGYLNRQIILITPRQNWSCEKERGQITNTRNENEDIVDRAEDVKISKDDIIKNFTPIIRRRETIPRKIRCIKTYHY